MDKTEGRVNNGVEKEMILRSKLLKLEGNGGGWSSDIQQGQCNDSSYVVKRGPGQINESSS